jgi:hypothetical protein
MQALCRVPTGGFWTVRVPHKAMLRSMRIGP